MGNSRDPNVTVLQQLAKLQETEHLWQVAFDAVQDPLFIHDIHYRITRANRAFLLAVGLPPEEVVGRPYWELLPRGNGPLSTCMASMEQGGAAASPDELEVIGERFFVSRNYPIFDAAGRPTGGVHVLADVTAFRRQEWELRLLNEAVRQVAEVVIITDPSQRILYVNPAAQRLFGYAPERLVGKPVSDYWSGGVEFESERICEALQREGVWSGETVRRASDGSEVPVHLNVMLLRDAGGRILGHLGTLLDLRPIKEARQALERERHDLRERIKELDCLHAVAALAATHPPLALEVLFEQAVRLLPPAWQYPEVAVARLCFSDISRESPGYRDGGICQRADIVVGEREEGFLEVCYLEPRPPADEGPFLTEERELLGSVARRLGSFVQMHRTRLELQTSEANYRALFESAADGIILADAETGFIVEANPAASDLTGWPAETLAGLHFTAIHPPEKAAEYQEIFRRSHGRAELVLRRRDGTERAVEVTATEGTHSGRRVLVGSFRDITERVRGAAALAASKERFELVVAAAGEGIWEWDMIRDEIWYSLRVRELLGFEEGELEPRIETVWQLLHPDELERTQAVLLGHLERGERLEAECRLRTKSAGYRWFRLRGLSVRDGAGTPLRIAGSIADVTSRHQAEQALAESERRLRTIVESDSDGILVVDGEGVIRYANPAAERLFGRTTRELEGMPLGSPMVAAGSVDELELVRPQGELIIAEVRVAELQWQGENSSLVFLHDITQRRHDEDRLRRLNRTYRLQSECSAALVTAKGESELFERFCHALVELGGYGFACVGLLDHEQRVQPAAAAGGAEFCGGQASGGPSPAAAATGEPQVVQEIAGEPETEWKREALRRGFGSAMAVPLHGDGLLLGALTVYAEKSGAFDREDHTLLTELASDLSFGIRSLRTSLARAEAEATVQIRNRAIEASRNGIVIADATQPGYPLVYVNPAFTAITGYERGEVLGRSPSILHGEDRAQPELQKLAAALRRRQDGAALLRNYRKDGTPFWNDLHVAPVRDCNGKVSHYVGILNDITAHKRHEELLEFQAHHDELTGLPNRNLMQDRLNQALSHARRYRRTVGVLFLDLDQFKVINDGLGHETGDELLVTVAGRLRACIREGDTVARYGGDEFVILFPEVDSEDDLSRVGRRILDAVSAPMTVGAQELQITTSIGASLFPRDGSDTTLLLRNADAAMYRAKESGRNNMQFYTAELNVRMMQRLVMSGQLRQALEREELRVHFQPQVDVRNGRLCGLEALVRWEHPEFGLVPPGQFIPLAEETGTIVPIGEWVLEEACRQVARWHAAGLPKVPVAVNVSARQLEQGDFPATVAAVLERTALDAKWLELELTESTLMQRPEEMAAQLTWLKKLGLMLSIDDFGTGYSSLAQLRRFPFDKIKIDRTFVKDITSDPNAASIALTIISMANSMRLRVIAEGVENEPQLQFLRRHGCHEIQGFYFSRPLPSDEIEEMLEANRHLRLREEAAAPPTLLLVDDERNITRALQRALRREGYRILVTNSPLEAFDLLASHQVQVIVSDQRMPGMTGTDFLSRVKEIYPDVVRMVLSGYTDLRVVTEAVNRGAIYKFLTKPWDDDQLRRQIDEGFAEYERQRARRAS